MRPTRAGILGLLLLITSLNCQQPVRDRGFGRVTDNDGKPWANAEVHLVHRPHEAAADPLLCDEIVVPTDARGQFKVELLAGSAYSAWAVGPLEDDRSYRCTAIVTAVARTPILLREGERRHALRIRPHVHDSWNGKESLRWRAARTGSRVGEWLQADDDGLLTLPRWPDRTIMLQAWAGSWMVYRTGFWLKPSNAIRYGIEFRSEDKPTADNVHARMAATIDVNLPPRRTRTFTLTAEGTGAPVADAAIVHEHAPHLLPAAHTKADGTVHAVFADEQEQARTLPGKWVIQPRDHAEAKLGTSSYRRGDPPVTAFELPPAQSLAGRLLIDQNPAGNVSILIESSVRSGPRGTWFGIDPRVAVSASDGSFTVRGRTDQYPFRLTATLSPSMRARLQGSSELVVAPLAVLRWEGEPLQKTLGDIHLDRLHALDIRVRQKDGTPPGSTRVVLARFGAGSDTPSEPVAVRTDHRGAVRVLMPDTDDLLVHAVNEHGGAWQRIDKDTRSCDLTIDARHVVRLRVVDTNGKPVAGASVSIVCPEPTGDVDRELIQLLRRIYMVHGISRKSCKTDADGHGTLLSPLPHVTLDLALTVDGKRGRTNALWDGNDDKRIDVEFRPRR